MAQVPTEAEIKEAQHVTAKKIQDKRSKQKAQGKSFEIEDHSAGVVPEKVWKGLKANEETK